MLPLASDKQSASALRVVSYWLSAVGFLALAVYVVHFFNLHSYGLWEDDYWSIAPRFGAPLSDLRILWAYDFTNWPTGRPLNHFLPAALATVGFKLGGLPGIYTIAMAWLALNVCLVWAILRRLTPEIAALAGALVYVVYPADTTRILLIHAAHVQGAMTFSLAGILLWLRKDAWRWAAYPTAALSLLSYETAIIPFLLVPLLEFRGGKPHVGRWFVHTGLCMAIVALDALIRIHTGDARASAAVGSISETIYRMLTSLYIGPATGARAFAVGIWSGMTHLTVAKAAAGLVLVGALAAVIALERVRRVPLQPGSKFGRGDRPSTSSSRASFVGWGWIAFGAVVTWSACYLLTIVNYPPTQLVGRLTSTHVAAAWPVALLTAALAEAVLKAPRRMRPIFAGLFALIVVTLTSYQRVLQEQYVWAWQQQKRFWKEVMEAAPDAQSGWSIIVTGPPIPAPAVIAVNSWADFHVFRSIIDGTSNNKGTAFAHLGYLGSLIQFRKEGEQIEWRPQFWGGEFVPIDPNRLVLLESDGQHIHRIARLSTVAGMLESSADARPPARTVWPETPVAQLLFGGK